MALGRDLVKRKKVVVCLNFCLFRRLYVFLRVVFFYLFIEKSFLKNFIKRLLLIDLVKEEGKMKCLL